MALFLIPRTQAESGVLAKIRPAHTRVKEVYGKTERYSQVHKDLCKALSMNTVHFGVPLLFYALKIVRIITYVTYN